MNTLADAVRVTLGPKGRNVVLDKKWGAPTITNDGVSIAKEIELEDPLENIGAELVKEVAKKTDDVAGDGTTTATVLAWSMVGEGMKNVAAGANPMSLKRGIEAASAAAVEYIVGSAIEVDDKEQIAQVAAISANDRQIGELIADAIDKVGKDGVVTVEESNTFGMELEFTEGMRFDKGYISPYFVTDQDRMEAVLEDPYILLVSSKISAVRELVPALEAAMQSGKPLLSAADHRRRHRRRSAWPPWFGQPEIAAPSTLLQSRPRGFAIVARRLQEHGHPHRWSGHLRRGRAEARRGSPLKCGSGPARSPSARTKQPSSKAQATRPTGRRRINQLRAEIENTDSDYGTGRSLQERLPSWRRCRSAQGRRRNRGRTFQGKEATSIEDAVQAPQKAAIRRGQSSAGSAASPLLQGPRKRLRRQPTSSAGD
ncbi:UNVERIFIED_CONTAM: hypothetical protein GTU68_006117 [Idotea baltica]|nr:hypothetical protein [Idotea baltica]